jgi:hypothetical protein
MERPLLRPDVRQRLGPQLDLGRHPLRLGLSRFRPLVRLLAMQVWPHLAEQNLRGRPPRRALGGIGPPHFWQPRGSPAAAAASARPGGLATASRASWGTVAPPSRGAQYAQSAASACAISRRRVGDLEVGFGPGEQLVDHLHGRSPSGTTDVSRLYS